MIPSLAKLKFKVYSLYQRIAKLAWEDDLHPRWPANAIGGRGGESMPLGRLAKDQLRREIEVLKQAKVKEQEKLDLIRNKPRNPVTGNRAGVHQVEMARIDLLIKARQAELDKGIEPEFNVIPRARSKFNPLHARSPAPKKWYSEEEKEK